MFKRILFLFTFLTFIGNSFAKERTLDKIEKYLNDIKYFQASFIQDDISNSALSEGFFYLLRPGKLRIEYKIPFEASLFTKNSITVYYDKELDEISNIPTKSTPLHFLLNKTISFDDKSFIITNFKEEKKNIFVSFREKNKEEQGELTLTFTKEPITLKEIEIVNELNQKIIMTLYNTNTKDVINDSIFNFKNPRLKRKV